MAIEQRGSNGQFKKEDVCAVIVTFNPDAGLVQRVMKIVPQVGGLVIVDNHSGFDEVAMLWEIGSRSNAHLIFNERNLGVATGMNIGVRWAKQRGYAWVVTLDQDTDPAEYMVEAVLSVFEALGESEKNPVAIIGSGYSLDNRTTYELAKLPDCYPWIETKTVISSGSFLSTTAYEKLGPFRDEFFIDFVDIEFCLRAVVKGFKVLLVCYPLMQHSIGSTTWHKLPWKQTGTSNHSNLRRYYMARNLLLLAQDYFVHEPFFVLNLLCSMLRSVILMCLFEENRLIKLQATVLGVWDGASRNTSRAWV